MFSLFRQNRQGWSIIAILLLVKEDTRMRKWSKIIPIALQVATVLGLVLSGIAGWKWGV